MSKKRKTGNILIRTPDLADAERRLGKSMPSKDTEMDCCLSLDLTAPYAVRALAAADAILSVSPPERWRQEASPKTDESILYVPRSWWLFKGQHTIGAIGWKEVIPQ